MWCMWGVWFMEMGFHVCVDTCPPTGMRAVCLGDRISMPGEVSAFLLLQWLLLCCLWVFI
jgi:hypothetical protein